jgi:hypothetical protein
LTVNQLGIVRLTIQHQMIVSISFIKYPRDCLRQTSADLFFLEDCPIHNWQSFDFHCRTPRCIPVIKLTTSDQLIANCGTIGNYCNLQSSTAGFILCITYQLTTLYSILT